MTDEIRPRRSVLYMPGANRRAHDKGRMLPADAIIIDLEDSIAPEGKAEARAIACDSVRAGGFAPREVALRVNGLDTPWGEADLAAAAAAGPDAIVLTKVAGTGDLERAAAAVRAHARRPVALWPMIETSRAILDIAAIAAWRDEAAPLSALVLGTNDIAKEMRMPETRSRAAMQPFFAMIVAAARANGLDVLDGVCNDFSDEARLRAECAQAREYGMDGKTLIHPAQIAAANDAFAPSVAELDEARRIVAAFDDPANRGRGAISLDGRMVEILHADIARRTLALGAAVSVREARAEGGTRP